MRSLIILLLGLCAIQAGAAQFYKWTDEQGKVHYSDQPPPNGEYQSVSSAPIPSTEDGQSSYERAKGLHQEQLAAEATEAKQEAAAQDAARLAAVRVENCRRARSNLETLEAHTRLLVPPEDGEGEPKRMTEEERQRNLAEARAAIEKYCG